MLRDHLHYKIACPNESHYHLGILSEVLLYWDGPSMKDYQIPLEIDFPFPFLWT